jgi:DNA-binding response OmpR family regulator
VITANSPPVPRIILVEDDRANATILKLLLEMDGYLVAVHADPERALADTTLGADAFIIDCHLSGRASGIELLKQIRSGQTAVDRETVAILTSGDERLIQAAVEAGANRFLTKPFSPSELTEELTALLK